tara:strand:- start:182 stop:427 length:246 start_codon:yes stop_codon:yes gene_type:complete
MSKIFTKEDLLNVFCGQIETDLNLFQYISDEKCSSYTFHDSINKNIQINNLDLKIKNILAFEKAYSVKNSKNNGIIDLILN